jgi:hypothetical protein
MRVRSVFLSELQMKRPITAIVLISLAACISLLIYRLGSADRYERACGIPNLFKADYTEELSNNISIHEDGSNVRVVFSNLERWRTVCLTSMYEDEFYFRPEADFPHFSRRVGRWQCGGNPSDAVTVLLVTNDGSALARQLSLEGVRAKLETSYEITQLPSDRQQCTQLPNATAECAWVQRFGELRCLLLFANNKSRK